MILLFAVKLHSEGHLYIQVAVIGESLRKETRPAKWEKALSDLQTYATYAPVPVPYLNEKEVENVNLKGFMVGNPETDDGYDWRGNMDYAWSHGIISDETHNIISSNCDFFSNNTWDNLKCKTAVDETLARLDDIDK